MSRTPLVPIAVFVVITSALLWTRSAIQRQSALTVSAETGLVAERFGAQLSEFIDTRLAIVEVMAGEWSNRRVVGPSAFATETERRMMVLPGFQAINWIDPDGIIRWVSPLEGNEGALDRNLSGHPTAGPALASARATGETQVTPPLDLLQGGPGFAAYVAIPPSPDGTPNGTLNAVFRRDHLIEAWLGDALDGRFHWSIHDGGQLVHAGGPAPADDVSSRRQTFRVRNREWTVEIAPTDAMVQGRTNAFNDVILFAATAVAFGISLILWRWMKSRDSAIAAARELQATIHAYPDIQVRLRGDGTVLDARMGPGANAVGTREDYVGRRVRDIMTAEGAAAFERAMRDAREQGLGRAEYIRLRDGRREDLEARAVPLNDDEFVVIIRDISARMRAERVQRGRNAVFEMLTRDAPLDEVMDRLILLIEEAAPECLGSVLLLDAGTGQLRHCAAPNLPADYSAAVDGMEIGPTVGSCGAAAATGKCVIVEDVLTHPNWTFARELIEPTGLRACWSAPIRRADGVVLGTFAMYYRTVRAPSADEIELIETAANIADIAIERSRARTDLRERERRLAEAQRAARLGSWEWREGEGLSWSPELARLIGLPPDAALAYESYLEIVHPLDRDDVRAALEQANARQVRFAVDHRIEIDGAVRFVHAEGRPELDEDGRLQRWYGHVQDITDLKEAEERQRLMLAELDHRVKNVLASVLALAEQSAAGATDIGTFTQALTGRIRSLAATHAALSATRWSGADLEEMLHLLLDAFADQRLGRISLGGEACRVPAHSAPALCLALHELTTNAAKYGSLSTPSGRVVIGWTVHDGELELTWNEHDGPAITSPPQPGFGTTLVRGFVEHDLRGHVEMHFEPTGLTCLLRFRLDPTPNASEPAPTASGA